MAPYYHLLARTMEVMLVLTAKANYFIWSIMPALLAWAALIAPVLLGTGLLIIAFTICLFVDLRAIKTGLWPAYMRQLRVILTVMACLSLSANFTLLTF